MTIFPAETRRKKTINDFNLDPEKLAVLMVQEAEQQGIKPHEALQLLAVSLLECVEASVFAAEEHLTNFCSKEAKPIEKN